MKICKVVYFIAVAIMSLMILQGQAHGVPYNIIPNGAIAMQYARNWSDRWENANESLQQGYKLGAVGFVLDERLMKYRIDTAATVTDSSYSGMPYSLDLRIRFLELGMSAPWRIARFPHPLSLFYSRYASYGNAVNSYGLNLEWNLPHYIQFFKDGNIIALSRERGGAISGVSDSESGRDLEWGGIESGYGEQPGVIEVEDEGWGEDERGAEEEWPEDTGAVGWGNGPGIWEPKSGAKDGGIKRAPSGRKAAVKLAAAPPLFSIPFPALMLDVWRNEFQDAIGTTVNNSAAFSLAMTDNRYSFASQMRYSDMTDASGLKASGNMIELNHRYRGPEFVLGPLSRGWDVVNNFSYNESESSTGNPVKNSSYLVTHLWQRNDSRAESRMAVTSHFSYGASSVSKLYSLGSSASFQKRFSRGITNAFALSGYYSRQENENQYGFGRENQGLADDGALSRERIDSKSASVSDDFRFDLFRAASCSVGGSIRAFTATTSKAGGLETSASTSLYMKSRTPLLVSGLINNKEYDDGSSSKITSLNAVMSGFEMLDTWFNALLGYSRNEVDNVDASSYSDEVVQYIIGFRKGVARGVSLSGTGRVESRNVLKDGITIRNNRRSGSLNLDMAEKLLLFRNVAVSLNYQYTDSPGEGVMGVLKMSPRFRHFFKMFSMGADYDYTTILQGRNSGRSNHAFRFMLSRPFGYIPRRWL
ncbi:MAG: hypothetical protein HZA20_02605 [Nitrospirae bacterium]|nr:hypothetical protein [Nitrospirota bacterium]